MRLERIVAVKRLDGAKEKDGKKGAKGEDRKSRSKPSKGSNRSNGTDGASGAFPPEGLFGSGWTDLGDWHVRLPPGAVFLVAGEALTHPVRCAGSDKPAVDALVHGLSLLTGRRASQPVAVRALLAFAASRQAEFAAFVAENQ